MNRPRRWPYRHDLQVSVFAGGWAAGSCSNCGCSFIGGGLWQRLFVPCRARDTEISFTSADDITFEQEGSE